MKARGAVIVQDPASADAMLVATCVVIEATERKVLRRLAELQFPGVPLAVTGCATSACAGKVAETAPGSGRFLPGDIEGPVKWLIAESGENPRPTASLPASARTACAGPRVPGAARIPFTAAGDVVCPIPIASGCRGSCSYCITRLARGSLRSRALSDVADEAQSAIEGGAAELQLCAQDAGVYGMDIGTSLAALVRAVASLEGDFMVRVGMTNPASVADSFQELLDAFESPKVYKFLHMPVQSGHDAILEAMGRKHRAAEALGMMRSFRRRFPGSTLATDVIVAFPGEGAEAHEATKRFLTSARPDIVNVTRFSPRPGTPAAEMADVPHGRIAKARSRELASLRMGVSLENNRPWVGAQAEVLATEKGKTGTTLARTAGYRQVVIPSEVELGKRYFVRICRASSINLFGKLTQSEQGVTHAH